MIPEAELVGEGDAWVLTAGGLVQGRWSKPALDGVTTYTDVDGNPIGLTPGRTWVALPQAGGATRASPQLVQLGPRGGADGTIRGMPPAEPTHDTGTTRVKRGLAEMLKGGVIMDVVDPEQAKIAEDAGAVAVMALERVPSDIRRDGGVARMSDPEMIEGIKAVVTIPVMAKARIGHFVEAQVLEALGVDYVDESEVLTPADEAHHIDKWAFTVPFVCGATNLGEALRRISEGACMIRSKGEAGTGNIVEAVRHLRSILGDIRKITQADSAELYEWAKRLQAPIGLVQEVAQTGTLPVPLFCAGGIATPADAALVMQLGAAGHLRRAPASSSPTTRPGGPRRSSRPPRTSPTPTSWPRCPAASGRPCPASRSAASRPSSPTAAGSPYAVAPCGCHQVKVGVLALQGAFARHADAVASLGAEPVLVRGPAQLPEVDALVLPGGESTTMSMLLESSGLFDPLAERLAAGLPALGTCAGMILLASEVLDGRPDQRCFGRIDLSVRRNGYGRQVDSFEADLAIDGEPELVPRRVHPGPRRRAGRARRRGARHRRRAARCCAARARSPSPRSTRSCPTTSASTTAS